MVGGLKAILCHVPLDVIPVFKCVNEIWCSCSVLRSYSMSCNDAFEKCLDPSTELNVTLRPKYLNCSLVIGLKLTKYPTP